MSIANNLQRILNSIPKNVTLVAVSKKKPVTAILEAYNAGQRVFGENKIQEMVEKHEQLPKDIEWHMIGHLQRNKVKYMAHFVHLIHGVDSLKTLKEINKQALKHQRKINCLLQVKIANEATKFGMSNAELMAILESEDLRKLKNIQIVGLMGMASFSDDTQLIQSEFKTLKQLFDAVQKYTTTNFTPSVLSMGMSGDYLIAIKEGSTMVRIGSAIFGKRNYN